MTPRDQQLEALDRIGQAVKALGASCALFNNPEDVPVLRAMYRHVLGQHDVVYALWQFDVWVCEASSSAETVEARLERAGVTEAQAVRVLLDDYFGMKRFMDSVFESVVAESKRETVQ